MSKYQDVSHRGVEVFAKELAERLMQSHQVDIITAGDFPSFKKIILGKYDVVIPLNGRFQSFLISWGRYFFGYKVLISGHSGIGRDDIWNIVVARPNVFVALTDKAEKWAKKFGWGLSIIRIYNGIDLRKFKPDGERKNLPLPKPVILSVGALSWYKHHERVIKAVARVKKGSLLIVGVGDQQEKLQGMGSNLLKGRFAISDYPYYEMPKLYRSVDLFTLPSWDREAFGIVYLEAMASNLPVVAPDDANRREIIGDAGFYVSDTTNEDEYADKIEKALAKKWDNLPRKQAEHFSWDKIALEYETLLRTL
ncbi:glycosyltransferase family 4 protein [Candidatus Daviesbacteria bacterium]|nr:glycosyltransferase family 4 protein [Candidatus Daviesbacteria bacterium]